MSLTPKNWKEFQHYKDRKPAWIKLHRELLDNYEFACLPVASRALAPCLWLLASEYEDGNITGSIDALAFRLRMSREDFESALKPLIDGGFFIAASDLLAERKPTASLEKERETETQERGRGRKIPGKMLLPDSWSISVSHYQLGKKLGLEEGEIGEAAAEMRDWSIGNREMRSNWDSVFNNWMRRNAKRKSNGHRGQRTLQDDSRSLTKAADRLIEANQRGEFTFGPRPGLSAEPGENVVQLLPKGRSE